MGGAKACSACSKAYVGGGRRVASGPRRARRIPSGSEHSESHATRRIWPPLRRPNLASGEAGQPDSSHVGSFRDFLDPHETDLFIGLSAGSRPCSRGGEDYRREPVCWGVARGGVDGGGDLLDVSGVVGQEAGSGTGYSGS